MADLALKAEPRSADLALAGCDAYLQAGRPEKALALFGPALEREERPELWALSFISALRHGRLPAEDRKPEAFGFLAEAAHRPRFFIDAAALSLETGDGLAARSWIGRAREAGLSVPAPLLWDAGLVEELATGEDARVGAGELRLMADAAWLGGDRPKAVLRWKRALALDPRGSWRTWASLASVEGEDLSKSGDPELAFLSQAGQAVARVPSAGRYEAMISLFPASPGARAAYAAALARGGREAEALPLLELRGGEAGAGDTRELVDRLRVGAALWSEGRLVAEGIALVDSRPTDSRALGPVLDLFLERGYYEDFLALLGSGVSRGLDWPRRAFHAACGELLAGEASKAEAGLVRASASEPVPDAPYALAVLAERSGRVEEARARLATALGRSADPRERCAIYKELGRTEDRAGRREAAVAAYRAAAAADPSDAEASRLARR
jgi:tetratricopeptide (TPR) repeat protein